MEGTRRLPRLCKRGPPITSSSPSRRPSWWRECRQLCAGGPSPPNPYRTRGRLPHGQTERPVRVSPGTGFSRELDRFGGGSVAPCHPGRPRLPALLGAAAAFLSHGALGGAGGGSARSHCPLQEPMGGERSCTWRQQGQKGSTLRPAGSAKVLGGHGLSEVRTRLGPLPEVSRCCR